MKKRFLGIEYVALAVYFVSISFIIPDLLFAQLSPLNEWTEHYSPISCDSKRSCFARQYIDAKGGQAHQEPAMSKIDSMKVWTSVSADLTDSLTQSSVEGEELPMEEVPLQLDQILDNSPDIPYRDIGAFELLKSSKLCGEVYLLKNEADVEDPDLLARIRHEQANAKTVEIFPGQNLIHKRNLEEKISFAYSYFRFQRLEKRRNFYLDQKTLLDYHVIDLEPKKDLTVDLCDQKIAKYDRKIRELDLKPEEYFNYKTVNKTFGSISEDEVIKLLDNKLADYLRNIALERFEVNTKLARAINNPKVEHYLQQVAKEVFENDDEDAILRINKFMGLFPSLEYSVANDPNTDMKPLLCRHVKKAHKLSRIRRRLRNSLIPISLITTITFLAPGVGAGVVYGMLITGGIVSISSGTAEAWLTWQAIQKRGPIRRQNKLLYKLYVKTNKVVNELKEKADEFEKLSPQDQKDLQYILKMEEDMDFSRINQVKQLYREDLLNGYLMTVAAGKIVTGPLNFVGGAAVVLGRFLTPLLVRKPV